MEALYFGVPVVGIPVAADQFSNMHKLVQRNMGVKLNLNNITESILHQVLTSLINNSTYRSVIFSPTLMLHNSNYNLNFLIF